MKTELLASLFCPKCQSSLELLTDPMTEKNGEIFQGVIQCVKCRRNYPVINYIPRMVDRYNYSESWGFLWKETGAILRDSFTGMPWHHDVIHGTYSEDNKAIAGTSPFGFEWPKTMTGQKILEIGPGTGIFTEHLVQTGAVLYCVDMSDAIDTFPEELLTRPNIHVIQADINAGVLKSDSFDRIWFFQVLQHTPDPQQTLINVKTFLKSGGELAVTSYKGRFHPWYYSITKRMNPKLSWKLISFWIPILLPIKYRIQKFLYRVNMPILAKILRGITAPIDPRNLYFEVLEGRMDDWLQGAMWKKTKDRQLLMKYVIINTFDTITPQYTNCCLDNPTMESWLSRAGYSSFKVWGKNGVRAKAFR